MFSFHIINVFGEERSVPSPEQGASRRILSALIPFFARREHKATESFFVIIQFVAPHLSRFVTRIFILSGFISFAINVPLFFMDAAIWVLFEPGEAHRSRTSSSSFG